MGKRMAVSFLTSYPKPCKTHRFHSPQGKTNLRTQGERKDQSSFKLNKKAATSGGLAWSIQTRLIELEADHGLSPYSQGKDLDGSELLGLFLFFTLPTSIGKGDNRVLLNLRQSNLLTCGVSNR